MLETTKPRYAKPTSGPLREEVRLGALRELERLIFTAEWVAGECYCAETGAGCTHCDLRRRLRELAVALERNETALETIAAQKDGDDHYGQRVWLDATAEERWGIPPHTKARPYPIGHVEVLAEEHGSGYKARALDGLGRSRTPWSLGATKEEALGALLYAHRSNLPIGIGGIKA